VINRRQWLYGMGLIAGCGTQVGRATGTAAENDAPPATGPAPLELSQYEPKSKLHVRESHVARSKFPSIDFHITSRGWRSPKLPSDDFNL
jgi:hypothetical protein